MEPAALSVPVLLGASAIIYWSGRKNPASWPLAAARITFLLFVLFVWQWVWRNIPADAFASPGWRHVSFVPALLGILCGIALESRRVLRTKPPAGGSPRGEG